MLTRKRAIEILTLCDAWQVYHQLPSDSVDKLIEVAAELKYRKAPDALGSTARMFHEYLLRRAFSPTAYAEDEVRGKRLTVIVTDRHGHKIKRTGQDLA